MKAVYLKEPGDISIKEIPEPKRENGQAKIRVKAVGICGSDISAYKGTSPLCTYPRVIGHEIIGDIVEIDDNEGLYPGDRVVVEPYVYCGHCYPCSIGRTNCCENLNVLGVHIDGGMSEYLCHPSNLMYKVPLSFPLEELAMIEPLSISLHAVNRLKVQEGEHVLIFGAGPIGNLAAQVALYFKAVPIVVDLLDNRLKLAESVGVKYVINPLHDDVMNAVKDITSGRMAECVIEATGASSVVRSTVDLVSYAGRIALVGWPNQEVSMPTSIFTKKELDVRGSRNSVGEFPKAIELITQGLVNVRPVISQIVSFDELPKSVQLLAEEPNAHLKIVGIL